MTINSIHSVVSVDSMLVETELNQRTTTYVMKMKILLVKPLSGNKCPLGILEPLSVMICAMYWGSNTKSRYILGVQC